ncbi:putative F-box/LRR-repeat protein At3g58880 [Bidens hawaiensis]|uniref:putative F-box/LRR-repeat protein At3g58880 n=1 Tax=Bidens hawaiensis TaxID=980011 RepID=UPI004049EACF
MDDDRISKLPTNIVDHILSFLNTPKDLVRMSVLSKTWFHLTASFPDLFFDNYYFISGEGFLDYVEYTTSRFCHHNVTARRLRLVTTIEELAELDIVNRCLERVLKNGVKELMIDITNQYHPEVPNYRLPDILLSVSVLESLTIRGCELPSSLMDDVRFKSLTYLRLYKVHIDNEAIEYLTTSCPLLQTFGIVECNGFDSFCAFGHQNLRNVWIWYNTPVERIDIEAPNLSTLILIDWFGRGAPQVNLASSKSRTTVTYMGCLSVKPNDFTDLLSNFPFIEDLRLVSLRPGNSVKLLSHSLRRLMLDCDLENLELNTPNLDLFVYSSSLSDQSMLRHLTDSKASMLCYPHGYVDFLWFHKLRRFLGKKNGFKALNLYIHTSEKFNELWKLKAIELPPYELQHVELQLDALEESSAQIAFVDVVLWCCRPRSLTLISTSPSTEFEEQSDLALFTYEKLLQQEDQGHTIFKIVSPSSSMFVALPSKGKAISFIKE